MQTISEILFGFFCVVAVNNEVWLRILIVEQQFAHFLLNLFRRRRVLFQPGDRVRFTLTDFVAVVAIPGTRFLNQLLFYAEVYQLAVEVDAFAVEDLEFGLFKRRGDLVFTTLTRVSLPTTLSPSFTAPMRRMSRRTEA